MNLSTTTVIIWLLVVFFRTLQKKSNKMYLSELKLWNFRKYGSDSFDISKPDLIVPFNRGLNVLIGENDSGKTSILDAIKLVLKTHAFEWIKVEQKDFYNETETLRIELKFKGFQPNEAKNFVEWLGWEGADNEAQPVLKLIYQVERKGSRIFPADVRAGMDETGYPLDAEAREYLKTTYLKALRDADNDLIAKKNSRLSQIFQGHDLFKKQEGVKHEFESLFDGVNTQIERWFNKDDSINGTNNKKQIKDVIDKFLHAFIGDSVNSTLTLTDPEIKSILEKIALSIKDGSNWGLGTMNRLYMAVELLHLNKEWNGLKLCLIEELEAHLHPQAQMKVIEALQNINGVQFILTTHSPNLASKVKLQNLLLCNGNAVFSLNSNSTRLNKDNYKYLERFLDVTKSNLFFAKGVIIIEGWTEEILIPAIAKKVACDLTKNEISIVNVGSTAYLHFAKIFLQAGEHQIRTKVSIVTDLDNRPDENGNFYDEKRDERKEKIEALQKELENTDIKIFIGKEWTLEWCLFKSSSLSNLFKESVSEIHSKTADFKDKTKFESKLIEKLKDRTLDKVAIASVLAQKIEDKTDLVFTDESDYIAYLINAIKYTCGNQQ